MTPAALALVIGAACLHSLWNALAKRAGAPLLFLWSSLSAASVLLSPVALWLLGRDGVPSAAIPFLAATTLLHVVYFYALGRSYRFGEFSRVYPIARGLGVALVPVIALVVFDERLSVLGVTGIGLVVAGIVGIQQLPGASVSGAARPLRLGPGTAWAMLTGLTIAAYSLVDKAGVARLHPVPYITLLGFGTSALLAPVALRDRAALRREWALNWRQLVAASAMNLTAYLLVLFAFRLAKVSYVVAGRELSIVLSAFIGSIWFGEGRLGPRLAGAGLVLAGVVCVALAR
ncbi:MAG TPA: DMT family transporter [Methylomirabilota bacterium]|jgi:drug/metabolite transporter (DMT)-like permease|nr:DMT family transporter [Methylomirabilota bacterium]